VEDVRRFEKPGRWRLLFGTGILLATQLATVWLSRQRPLGDAEVLGAASVVALGLLAIGALNLRHTPYPRWLFAAMTGILAAAVLLTPVTASSPEAWAKDTRDGLWMFPWYLLILSTLPASRRGACAADSPYMGWFMIGSAVLLGVMIQLSTRLPF
jgi:hypothetical protein